MKIREFDNVTKIVLIILVSILGYFLAFLVISPLLMPKQTPMSRMMNEMIGVTFTNNFLANSVSLIFGVVIGLLVSIYLFKKQKEEKDYNILKRALSDDEKKVLDEIKKAKEITQDSLRFRLNWSKAKISTILTNLDRKGIIQRERTGKTYKVYLDKQFKTV